MDFVNNRTPAAPKMRLVQWLLALMLLGMTQISMARVLDRVVAVVNDDVVLLSEVDALCLPHIRRLPADLSLDESVARKREIREKTLEMLIDERLMGQQIRTHHIQATDDEVNKYLTRLREANKMSEEQFSQALAYEGKTLAAFKAELGKQIQRDKLLGRELQGQMGITEKEVEEYYRENYASKTASVKVRARHILFAVGPKASATKEDEAKRRGEKVLAALQAGADFAETAKAHSDDTSAAAGGDLGWFRRGDMVGPFEIAAFGLKKGQMSKLVRTRFGFHIILVTDRQQEGVPDMDKVGAEIRTRLMKEKRVKATRNWLQGLRRQSFIEIKL